MNPVHCGLAGAALLLFASPGFGGGIKTDGLVESATGVKFPDGSIQAPAAVTWIEPSWAHRTPSYGS